jgi:hypothetical protein
MAALSTDSSGRDWKFRLSSRTCCDVTLQLSTDAAEFGTVTGLDAKATAERPDILTSVRQRQQGMRPLAY